MKSESENYIYAINNRLIFINDYIRRCYQENFLKEVLSLTCSINLVENFKPIQRENLVEPYSVDPWIHCIYRIPESDFFKDKFFEDRSYKDIVRFVTSTAHLNWMIAREKIDAPPSLVEVSYLNGNTIPYLGLREPVLHSLQTEITVECHFYFGFGQLKKDKEINDK